MNNPHRSTPTNDAAPNLARRLSCCLLWLLACVALPAMAAQTDISNAPITNTTSAQVKPNIMLLMDTSGSMGWGHMPDEVESVTGVNSVGYKSNQCNVLYYNPTLTYQLPKRPDGTFFPTPSFTAAPYAGYASYYTAPDSTDQSVVDLSQNFRAYDAKTLRYSGTVDVAQPAYYYVYSGTKTLSYASAPCTDADSGFTNGVAKTSSDNSGTWTRVVVSTAADKANFAIWYSYYRVRISLIKSAASLAFTPLTDSFRVGFIQMQPKDSPTDAAINPAKYLAINDFNSTQRNLWFNKLFSQIPGGASPAREGLARVGRMYAGKHDGINSGMNDDPVQYSCQQNFTIMTTDGYWNTQTESSPGGPVQIDGATLVAGGNPLRNPDGTLTADSGLSPRPIWDGTTDGAGVLDNYSNQYAYAPCGSFAYRSTSQLLQSTVQITQSTSQMTQSTTQPIQSTIQYLASTIQNLQSTVQNLQATSQILQSTSQLLKSTNQNLQNTAQTTQSTTQTVQSTQQILKSTNQNLQSTAQTITTATQVTQTVSIVKKSTNQNLKSTTQNLQSTTQTTQSTAQQLQSTSQLLKSTTQNLQSTTQTLQSTSQNLQSTVQNRQSTVQNLQSTSQTLQSTSRTDQSTLQLRQSTSQTTITTLQVQQATSQTAACDARTEKCTYVAPGSCTVSTYISCSTVTTGPALVASCAPVSPTSTNNYYQVTCTSSGTGPVGTASCTPASASASNSYTTTTCSTVNTGPTLVASCTPITASAGNNYTATSCTSTATGPTPVASCTSAAANSSNNYTATTCTTTPTGPTPVASCTPAATPNSGNNYTTTTCTTNTTTNVPVASCAPATASSSNNYTTTSCPTPITTTNVPVANCAAATASSSNNYTTTTCPAAVTTSNVPVASCTASSASSSNNYTTTTCSVATSGPTGVSTCTGASPNSGNNYTTTTCTPNNTTSVPVASCTASGPTSANGYTTTSCPAAVVTTDVPSASCTPASASSANSWTTTSCRTATTTNVPVASCTAATATSATNYKSTTCSTASTGPTGVASCTPVSASSGNNYTVTSCGTNNTTNVAVASCTPSGPTSANGYVTTSCGTNNTSNVPVATCSPSSPTSANSYVTTTCPAPVVTTNVPVATCTAASASSANNYTTTTCVTTTVSGPTVVASCTPVAPTSANGYQSTTCGSIVTNTPSATCTASGPTAGNNYTTTTCGTNTTTNVPVATCTASAASAANNWTATTCPAPVVTTNVPAASCAVTAANAGNNYTSVTCPAPITTTNVPVGSCASAAASSSNNYTSVACSNVSTGPTGVSSCTSASPNSGNNYVTTTCGTNNTSNVPVATCTASGPNAGNGYTTTTCPSAIVTTDVPASACTPAGASSGNSYTTTTCRTATTTNVPVASCTAAAASSGNSYTATSCVTATTGPTPVATCTVIAATAGNNYVATSCPSPIVTTNVPVATCVAADPVPGNSYVKTTCPAPITTSNVPVASCSASSASSANSYVTTSCPAPIVTTNVPVASCTVVAASSGNNYVATSCPAPVTTGPIGVASCTHIDGTSGNNYVTTNCTPVLTGPTGVPSCTAVSPNSGNGFTTTSCATNQTTNVPVASCTSANAGSGNLWTSTSCTTATTGPTLVDGASCVAAAASSGNSYTATICAAAFGKKLQYKTTHTQTTQFYSGGIKVGSPSVTTTVGSPSDVNGTCYQPGSEPEPYAVPNPEPLPTLPAGCTSWAAGCPSTLSSVNGGSINSLADVAQYYYATDLRPAANWPANISDDNVRAVSTGPESDRATWQHMTTFAIGLGVSGTLNYRSDYLTAQTGDFASIRTGISTLNTDGTSTATQWPQWPDPNVDYANFENWNNPRSIDDFWHAAVNGRGKYFSAGNPTSVIAGLNGALTGIAASLGSGSAAAVTTLQPVAGNNTAFVPSYTTSDWTGEVQALQIDPTTGAVLDDTPATPALWAMSAQKSLDTKTAQGCDYRKIYLIRAGATNNMVNFAWNSSPCDSAGQPTGAAVTELNASEQAYFGSLNVSLLSQYPAMTDGTAGTQDQRTPAAGANLVNFLRGQRGLEGFTAGDKTKLYRTRLHVLGDIVNGGPVYVQGPANTFQDAGYYDFKTANAGRRPMLYVPANDGMLHALYAGNGTSDTLGGQEAWAIIPSMVLPNLYKLADSNYANTHQYFVDGTPTVADAYDTTATAWKTILVAGLNLGGKGYYAIDITSPTAPKVLWEFKLGSTCYDGSAATAGGDCHIGYTFGKPVVTKLADGTWVVLVTSGYNNINAPALAGDGQGYLYVLNAFTGQIIYRITAGTNVGDVSTPSGLGQINTFVDDITVSNTAVRVYGGDLLGNVWRFDVNDNLPPAGREASLVGTLKDPSGIPQPITTRPELAELNGKPMVLVGTGRLLGASDVTNQQVQSVYGIVDPLSATAPGDLRAGLVPLTITSSAAAGVNGTRTVACAGTTQQCASANGWVLDLPDPGERVNVNMKLQNTTLVFASNVPQNSACVSGGYSWLNQVDFSNGSSVVSPGTSVSTFVSNALIAGFNILDLSKTTSPNIDPTQPFRVSVRTTDGRNPPPFNVQVKPPTPLGKRISWREIVQ